MSLISNYLQKRKERIKRQKIQSIEAQAELRFIRGCEAWGDDRLTSFEFFKLVQREKNEQLSKIK